MTIKVTGIRITTGVREELNEFAAQAWRDGTTSEAFTDIREEPAATKHPDADCPDPCPYCAAWRAKRDAAPADASLEARAKALGRDIIDKLGPLAPAPPRYFRDTCIALVRAVDASRPAAKWDPVGGRPVEPTEADLLEGATMGSRPGLTEEQARRDFEAAIRDAVAKGGPYGNTHAREAVAALDAAIAAEHARQEAEHGSPVPRADVERALIWGGILREQERRVAEKEEQIAAMRAPADAPSLARARAVTRLLALGLDGQEVAHLLADAARIVAGRGRLTSPEALAILADYVAPADASLEARAEALGRIVRAAWVEVAKKEAKTVPQICDGFEPLGPREAPRPRGETGPDDQTVCMAAAAKAGWAFYRETGRWTGPSPSDPEIAVEMLQWEADVDAAERAKLSRGGTGAVPTGLTSIMADAQQRPSTAPDPRATLHVGDPASLAEVVAASAREPHADVVLHALHVSGGAAAVEAVTKSDVEEGERLLAAHRRVNAIEDPRLRHAARVRLSMSYIDEQTAIERGARIDGADMVWPDGARYPRCLP